MNFRLYAMIHMPTSCPIFTQKVGRSGQPWKGHGFVLCLYMYVNTILHVSFNAPVSTLTERLRKRQRCCKTAIKVSVKLLKRLRANAR